MLIKDVRGEKNVNYAGLHIINTSQIYSNPPPPALNNKTGIHYNKNGDRRIKDTQNMIINMGHL
jgi:hypothetical protein